MGFADILRLYQQPSALDMDPEVSRELFLRDMQRASARGFGLVQRQAQQDRYDFDRDLAARGRAAHRANRNLAPRERTYHAPAAQATAPLLLARLRDAAIQQYNVSTPTLREAGRAGRA